MTDFSLPSVSLVRSQLESVLLVVDAPESVSALAVGLAVSAVGLEVSVVLAAVSAVGSVCRPRRWRSRRS